MIEILKKEKVAFAYLFGSKAKNEANAMSDTDIAVYFSAEVPAEEYFERRLNLITKLSQLTKTEVDILVLNERYDEFVLEVLKTGKLIFETDPQIRANFRYKFTRQYLDFLPYREYYFSQVINRLKSGKSCDTRAKRYKNSIEKIRRMRFNSQKYS